MVPYLAFNKEVSKRFRAITALDEKVFGALLKSLAEQLDGFGLRGTVHEYAEKIAGGSASEFAMAVESVMPLLANELYSELPADDVVKGVIEGLVREDSYSQWTVGERKLLKLRLKKILTDTNVKLRARAWTLVLERPGVLASARILTDLRPVFAIKNPAAIEACTVIHTLVMNVQEGDINKTLHIAIDTKDLASLRAGIDRAEQKEKSLNGLASRAGVASLQIK